ncbi:MAG: ribonuclease HII [Fimbriimonadaceae bacterium]
MDNLFPESSRRPILATAGVDEAGRGPLAGPVVVAAVILPDCFDIDGIVDSKKLDAAKRERAADRIRAATIWRIERSEAEEIDRINILRATLEAMRRAVSALPRQPDAVIVDGNRLPVGVDARWRAEVRGDARFPCVAAASILAKTERDRIMRAYAEKYPQYGFDRHFGYPTLDHLAALAAFGPSPIHRLSFAPVQAQEQPCLTFDG